MVQATKRYDFDEVINRIDSDCAKWGYFGEGVLPLWVADMDFRVPPPVTQALIERAEHCIFGYTADSPELRAVIAERMDKRYGWQVLQDEVALVPGLVTAMNIVCRAVGAPGDDVLTLTPAYPPFLSAPGNHGQRSVTTDLRLEQHDGKLAYTLDFAALDAAITPQTKLFMLCNPHNPVGRVYTREELERIAEICLRHDLIICSDEIHSDLLFNGSQHIPIASLSPEIAERTITLLAPSKTFNIAGLYCGAMIAQNPELLQSLRTASAGIVPHINNFGYVGALAAYEHGQEWLDELLVYLEGNRDYLVDYITEHLPDIAVTKPEGTYLAWLDCRALNLPDNNAHLFFLNEAKVALNNGADFGEAGVGFVRLNFACPRATLTQALEQMHDAAARL